ncbi:hypothetical protein F4824DRAFT_499762 [Ustulina deusta]|nr:hypothetical protein F4824DRAFT_499762 [Ustulina deusta]
MSRVQFLEFLLWLKPRDLDRLLDIIAPAAARQYNQFMHDSVTNRIALEREQEKESEEERRQDVSSPTSLSCVFFYLIGDPPRYQKLAEEIRTTF